MRQYIKLLALGAATALMLQVVGFWGYHNGVELVKENMNSLVGNFDHVSQLSESEI